MKDTFQELTSICHENQLYKRSIAFDPSNNYLITVGDDTQINVFQYLYEKMILVLPLTSSDLIYKISKLFSQNPLNVRYKEEYPGHLMGTWCLSHGIEKSNHVNIFDLVTIGKWTNFACDVVKFNPKIFSSKRMTPASPFSYCIWWFG